MIDQSRRLSDGTRNVRAQRMIDASRTAPFREWPRRRVVDSFGGFDLLVCGHRFNTSGRPKGATARHCFRCYDESQSPSTDLSEGGSSCRC